MCGFRTCIKSKRIQAKYVPGYPKTHSYFDNRKIRAIFVNSTPLFSKNILHTLLGGFFFDLKVKGLYILDSIRSMA